PSAGCRGTSCRLTTATPSSTRAGRHSPSSPRRPGPTVPGRRSSRGRSEAPDVAQQHPVPPGPVEGQRGGDPAVPAVQVAEAAARRVQRLRHLQRPPGPRGLTSGPGVTESYGRPAGPETTRIAVDLLGGDDAPAVVVDGALLALDADPELRLHLVGPREVADEVLQACAPERRDRCTVEPVRARVGMTDAPSRAMRRDTTVRAGVAAVAEGRAHALVSAGMSGATVTAAALGLGRLAGVRKPALAALLPAQLGPVVLVGGGASAGGFR